MCLEGIIEIFGDLLYSINFDLIMIIYEFVKFELCGFCIMRWFDYYFWL